MDPTNAWPTAARLQPAIDSAYPSLVTHRSMSQPKKKTLTPYDAWNAALISPNWVLVHWNRPSSIGFSSDRICRST